MSPDRSRRPQHVRGKSLIPAPALRKPARIIYVVSEGQVTEPDYCRALTKHFRNTHNFSINTKYSEGRGLHPHEVAIAAISAATTSDRGDDGPVHEVWALFDRDEHTDVHQAFDLLRKHNVEAAKKKYKQVRIAFSHPSFDLWLLLHFQSLTVPQDGSNELVQKKLREYREFAGFAAKTSGSKKITEARAAQLMPLTETAVRNARALIKRCPGNGQ